MDPSRSLGKGRCASKHRGATRHSSGGRCENCVFMWLKPCRAHHLDLPLGTPRQLLELQLRALHQGAHETRPWLVLVVRGTASVPCF